MREDLWVNMLDIAERRFTVPGLLDLAKRSLEAKKSEKPMWGDLTIRTHDMLGGECPAIARVGAVTELLLLALDIMDDMQDRDNMEHPWMKAPSEQAMNVFFGFVTACIAELGDLKAEYPDAAFPDPGHIGMLLTESVNGQHLDLTYTVETEEDYVEMVRRKSASLLRLTLYMGSSCCTPSAEVAEKLDMIAIYIGMMAQLENDLNDMLRFDFKNDLVQKKKTLPILFLLDEEEDDPFTVIRDYYAGRIERDVFLSHKAACVQYITDSGSIEYTRTIQNLYLHHADELFAQIPGSEEAKKAFRDLAMARYEV